MSGAEATGRLNTAVDARDRLDPEFVIVARTGGFGAAGGGIDEAIRRANLYRVETGIDVIFYEGFQTWEQAELALRETPGSNASGHQASWRGSLQASRRSVHM
ncbi:isocitrate lyase/phosphoenolpyruvate mutase family protein [Streptomyces sp. NBC_01635]|nr:isocitrate lyase/phosphoenolpyruvate mutase family protein [Streptomyces sp. NBC_01635]